MQEVWLIVLAVGLALIIWGLALRSREEARLRQERDHRTEI